MGTALTYPSFFPSSVGFSHSRIRFPHEQQSSISPVGSRYAPLTFTYVAELVGFISAPHRSQILFTIIFPPFPAKPSWLPRGREIRSYQNRKTYKTLGTLACIILQCTIRQCSFRSILPPSAIWSFPRGIRTQHHQPCTAARRTARPCLPRPAPAGG